ncbi:NAD(P)-dependent dehydrogenase (short-subunit alcohol dehydrogenase family) [Chryseobacterium defluvii]|uniref:NAD(P)-dependent dehydrogenase (Short-subunit alcohol dehydrogenase family) n=1 Tax=Chryseobacterium defluvii TaxID=160396 RepID=A0A840K700_9FLAO|nr:SDR family NAD(P)-dependent oxidoreductase [Chryseobacterium defluvii]MBB4804996.1 NAD(P)-dependent dehydrogenase (short-subunit alcohol dehydrogenase family) [Chryseobacterium defluvii]
MQPHNKQENLQKPIHSGFNSQSTAEDVIKGIDLSGKTVIITGGYAGIGLETTRILVSAGAKAIIPARDVEKARKNLAGIENIELESLDLMDPDSINAFAEKFIRSGRDLHLLINNAGIMWVPLRRDKRGIESQLATNYLGPFHLTAKLWPALKKANGARVINVSSYGHQMSPFHFDDPNFEHREYQTLLGYGQSKTACNLFAVELDSRAKAFNVRAYSLHPGSVYGTDLGRDEPIELYKQMGTHDENGHIKPEVAARLKTVPQGAATTVWCATSLLLEDMGGVYCEDCDIAEPDLGQIEHRYDDPSTIRGVQPYSIDKESAKQLWILSEEMTGIKFEVE